MVSGLRALLLLLGAAPLARADSGSSCHGWRQTGGCDPNGPREPQSDGGCQDVVQSGQSGYCECTGGERVSAVTCEHAPLVCAVECIKNIVKPADGRSKTSAAPRQEEKDTCRARTADGGCADGISQSLNPPVEPESPLRSQQLTCSGWRQTHSCNPLGKRDPGGDKRCSESVPGGASGYCECVGLADGARHQVRLSTCDHPTFSCEAECRRASHYACDGWRQTGNCTSDGPREEERDQACAASVAPGVSGFCECGGGLRRVSRPPKCSVDVDAERCEDVCLRGEGLYDVLNVYEGASDQAIRQAFRRLSLKLHPDKQRTDEQRARAAIRFAEVREAYDTLSDPDSRILYDMHGHVAAGEKASKQRGGESNVETHFSLSEAYTGKDVTMTISRRVVCKGCAKGAGEAGRKRCTRCGACPNEVRTVNVQMGPFVMPQQQEVASDERCEQQHYTLEARARRGISDGAVLTFARASEQRPGMIPGDVKMKINVAKDPRFVRRGADLHTEVHISLREALLGFKREIRHLDGHAVAVQYRTISKPGLVLRIAGEGMPLYGEEEEGDLSQPPNPSTAGMLHLKIVVDFPEALSAEAKKWAAKVLPP